MISKPFDVEETIIFFQPNAKKMVLPQELNSCEIMKKMSPAIRNKKEVVHNTL